MSISLWGCSSEIEVSCLVVDDRHIVLLSEHPTKRKSLFRGGLVHRVEFLSNHSSSFFDLSDLTDVCCHHRSWWWIWLALFIASRFHPVVCSYNYIFFQIAKSVLILCLHMGLRHDIFSIAATAISHSFWMNSVIA
jgi:hypothetical protein